MLNVEVSCLALEFCLPLLLLLFLLFLFFLTLTLLLLGLNLLLLFDLEPVLVLWILRGVERMMCERLFKVHNGVRELHVDLSVHQLKVSLAPLKMDLAAG